MRGLEPARRALDARLSTSAAPLAVALSGGSDSTALLLLTADWAAAQGRPLVALTVDHGINPDSAAWTERCRALAERLGAGFHPLLWDGPKPAAGLPARARQARHRLLAEAARRAGARVLLMGHTADDLAEAAAMRAAGSTVPSPREWSPSPVWPEGRGVFLLRPLLQTRRKDLRDWLESLGQGWIDDPANADLRFARARARSGSGLPPSSPEPVRRLELAAQVQATPAGELAVDRALLREAPDLQAFIAAACLCAAGTQTPPKRDRLDRLAAALAGADTGIFTLSGARILAEADEVRFTREPGESARGGLAHLALRLDEPIAWDGRFEAIAARPGLILRPLAGVASQLPPAEQAAVRALGARTRGALPALIDGARVHCPLVQPASPIRLRALAAERLAAACGLVEREPG